MLKKLCSRVAGSSLKSASSESVKDLVRLLALALPSSVQEPFAELSVGEYGEGGGPKYV